MEETNKKQHRITLIKAIKIFAILTALFFIVAVVGGYGSHFIWTKNTDLNLEEWTRQDIFIFNLFYWLQNVGRFFVIFGIVTVNLLMIYLFKNRANVIEKIKHIKITKKQIIAVGVVLLAIFAYVGIANKEQEPELTPTERAINNEVRSYVINYCERNIESWGEIDTEITTIELDSDDEEQEENGIYEVYKIYGKCVGTNKFGEDIDSKFTCMCSVDDSEEIDVFVYDLEFNW